MSGIPTPTEVLGALITPAVLISAAGMLVLSTSQRLSRVVDRGRVLATEAERLQGPPGSTFGASSGAGAQTAAHRGSARAAVRACAAAPRHADRAVLGHRAARGDERMRGSQVGGAFALQPAAHVDERDPVALFLCSLQ
jgi:hypothetical protein